MTLNYHFYLVTFYFYIRITLNKHFRCSPFNHSMKEVWKNYVIILSLLQCHAITTFVTAFSIVDLHPQTIDFDLGEST